ncbi:sporulation protein YunB [Paenibacillus sp. NPDC057934]|uniref:sporulation protein YunB n=1 Tax=Paenibacillus sp. NPDC057934 TaxID=3346282 RepID=UPI0036DAC4DA
MGRNKKWGSRRIRMPDFGRIRLPKISWDSIPRPAGRSPAFKARPSKTTSIRPQSARFEAKRSRRSARLFSRRERQPSSSAGTRGKSGSRRKFWLILSLLLLLGLFQSIRYVEQHLKPPIVHLAQIRVKQIATESINKAITSQVASGGNAEELIDWKTDKNGKISGFMLNYAEHMRITSQAATVIQSTLQELHNKRERIPLGQALGSPLIASFGPDIPITIEPQGAVKVELATRQKNAGINMILVEVYIHIVTEVAVVIPFDMQPQVVDTEIPVSYLMVVGDVPMYYYDNQGQPVGQNGSSAPGIAIPAPQIGGEKEDATVHGNENSGSVDTGTPVPTAIPEISGSGSAPTNNTSGVSSGTANSH